MSGCSPQVSAALEDVKIGISMTAAAKKHGVTTRTISKWGNIYGIIATKYKHFDAETIQAFLDELQEGVFTIPQLAKKHGYNTQTVRQWVQRYNVTDYKRKYHMGPEMRLTMIDRAQVLRFEGLDLIEITSILEKELGPVKKATVTRWVRDLVHPWRKKLITEWKRSNALHKYIEELSRE